MYKIMYELEVRGCSDGAAGAAEVVLSDRPALSTFSDIMQVQHTSRKVRKKAQTFPYLAKLYKI